MIVSRSTFTLRSRAGYRNGVQASPFRSSIFARNPYEEPTPACSQAPVRCEHTCVTDEGFRQIGERHGHVLHTIRPRGQPCGDSERSAGS
jgi:hypothetical protein